MASQNNIETINVNGHTIEIYQDATTKYRWRAMIDGTENAGSSEQGFENLELCKQNLQNLAEILNDTITQKTKKVSFGATKVEVMSSSDKDTDELSYSEEQKAMDWNIFWLIAIILLLSMFIFAKLFLFR